MRKLIILLFVLIGSVTEDECYTLDISTENTIYKDHAGEFVIKPE